MLSVLEYEYNINIIKILFQSTSPLKPNFESVFFNEVFDWTSAYTSHKYSN